MKNVALKEMTLTNFKGHKNLTIQFGEETVISGDNRLGKSTIFDAFIWLLFGKDQFDRKDYEIIPIVDSKRVDRINPEVVAVINYDGREMSLKRVLSQKWVRRRGTAEEVFDGCETLYYINDVPLKAGEYKARIDLMIEETVFKLITNPAAFLSMHWTKQREFLFQIAGTVSDADVAASDPQFKQLLELVNGKSLVDFKKEISARKKKLKTDLDDINPKIDQTSRLTPAQKDFQAIELEIALVEKGIESIDLQIADRSKAIRSQYEEVQRKQGEVNSLRSKQREVVNEANIQAQNELFEAKKERIQIENEIAVSLQKIQSKASLVEQYDQKCKEIALEAEKISKSIQTLREEWNAENSREYTEKTGCLTCPVFGHDCTDTTAAGKHAEAQEKAREAFLKAKQEKLDSINAEGKRRTKEKEAMEAGLQQLEADYKKAHDEKDRLRVEHIILTERLEKCTVPEIRTVIPAELPKWQEIEGWIKVIEATIEEVKPVDNADLTSKKSELNIKRDELKKALLDRDLIQRYAEEIEKLEKQAQDIAQQIADIEKQEFTIDAFNRVKIEECDRRINRMFQVVKFQLFDKTLDGNEFEACIPLNKAGIPIAATNTAEKINAGIDIINTLSRFYNVSAPVFIDNSEAVNSFIPSESQMIHLRVTTDKVLTVK